MLYLIDFMVALIMTTWLSMAIWFSMIVWLQQLLLLVQIARAVAGSNLRRHFWKLVCIGTQIRSVLAACESNIIQQRLSSCYLACAHIHACMHTCLFRFLVSDWNVYLFMHLDATSSTVCWHELHCSLQQSAPEMAAIMPSQITTGNPRGRCQTTFCRCE